MNERQNETTKPRRPGTIGTSDRFTDAAGRLWKMTRKGWRLFVVRKGK